MRVPVCFTRHLTLPRAAALVLSAAVGVAALQPAPVLAQAKPAPAPKSNTAPVPQAAPEPPKEVALTEAQIAAVIATQKDFDAIAAKIPQAAQQKPDPKIVAQFEDTAKKAGFASYADYNAAVETIGIVLGGIDPKTKTYVGPEAIIQQQIAALEADKKLPAAEKKAALAELAAMAKSPPPPLQNKSNIDLVTKNYDKLAEIMQDDE